MEPVGFPRTATVEFQEPRNVTRRASRRHSFSLSGLDAAPHRRPSLSSEARPHRGGHSMANPSRTLTRTATAHTTRPALPTSSNRNAEDAHNLRRIAGRDVGFGGFPMPHEIIGRIAGFAIPKISNWLHRTVTIPARTLSISLRGGEREIPQGSDATNLLSRTKSVPYISFDAVVGRNSHFYDLREEELEELGGVEYRALSMLLWLVPLVGPEAPILTPKCWDTERLFLSQYFVGIQLIAFTVIAPYMALSRWKPVFASQIRPLSSSWSVTDSTTFSSATKCCSDSQVLGIPHHVGIHKCWVCNLRSSLPRFVITTKWIECRSSTSR